MTTQFVFRDTANIQSNAFAGPDGRAQPVISALKNMDVKMGNAINLGNASVMMVGLESCVMHRVTQVSKVSSKHICLQILKPREILHPTISTFYLCRMFRWKLGRVEPVDILRT